MKQLQQLSIIGNIVAVDEKDNFIVVRTAVDNDYKENDEWKEGTLWVNCLSTDKSLKEKFKKGDRYFLQGNLNVKAYINKDGEAMPDVSMWLTNYVLQYHKAEATSEK